MRPKSNHSRALLRLEAFLPYRLSVLSNLVSGGIAETYSARFGLSIPEWRVIAVLSGFPGISAAEVARRTAMDKVAVSRAIARLLDKDCLQREVSSEDRRRSVLRLTADGEALFREISPLAKDYETRLLSGMRADDKKKLDAILEQLSKRAKSLAAGN